MQLSQRVEMAIPSAISSLVFSSKAPFFYAAFPIMLNPAKLSGASFCSLPMRCIVSFKNVVQLIFGPSYFVLGSVRDYRPLGYAKVCNLILFEKRQDHNF